MNENKYLSKGIDWIVIFIYVLLVAVGILCIYMVEYRPQQSGIETFFTGKTNYSRQLFFAGICIAIGIFILLLDSKVFAALANVLYIGGILLMLATFVIGKDINGSKSWIPLGGGFNLQPAEICKIFTSLALAKFISRIDTDFKKLSTQIIAAAIALMPAVLSILQNETGLALVYGSFFIMMYREGLPGWLLVVGFSFGALVVATLIVEPNTLAILLTIIAFACILFYKRQIRKSKKVLFFILSLWVLCVGVQRFVVPYIFNNVFQCYQSQRIYSMVGQDYDCSQNKSVINNPDKQVRKPDDYNVRQSKIAIGSGGLTGRGFLKGTQTRGRYVPEQHTDFIFTSLGEAFGFAGTMTFVTIYFLLLIKIIFIAERQRSAFSRIYAYCVASILFLHITINVCMTIGLFPIIGIPLPLISYGGSSLVTFTVLLFILVRLDADRQIVIR